jgi:uridine kinase
MTAEKVQIEIDGSRTTTAPGRSLHDVLRANGGEDIWGDNPVVLASVDGRRVCLAEPLWGGERISLLRRGDPESHSTSVRTLCSVLAVAAEQLFPAGRLVLDFGCGSGLYGELEGGPLLSTDDLTRLEVRMRELAARDLPLTPRVYGQRELLRLLAGSRREFSFRAARYARQDSLTLFTMEGSSLLFQGPQLPSTGSVRAFALRPEPPGFMLLPSLPGSPDTVTEFTPQPKLLETMRGYSRWSAQQGFPDLGSLNRFIVEGRAAEVIHVEEARHEQTLVSAAVRATALPDEGRLILVAGPSSSGKTSFAKRLAVQMRVLGFTPAALSLDDYFVPRDATPRDANGDYDFEALAALQVDLLNTHLQALLAGEAVRLPRYDFHSGSSTLRDETFRIPHGQPLIVEGIHALNPELTATIPQHLKLRVYVSALCHYNLDDLSYVPTHLSRLFRRIVRDAMFRGYTASQTLARWPQVRAGEQKWIFPFQQNADIFFNAGLAYELGVLKLWAEPRLAAVEPDDQNYGRARSLLELLALVLPIDAGQVPPISLLREFIGGSGFRY